MSINNVWLGSTVYLAGVQDIVSPILRKALWYSDLQKKGNHLNF